VPQARDQPVDVLQLEVEAAGSGMAASDLKRKKELEAENPKLKRMYAELSLENGALKDLIEKKL
jgi:putative transposase